MFGHFLPRVTIGGLWLGLDDLLPLLSLPLILFFYMTRRHVSGPSYRLVLPLLTFVIFFGFYGVLQGFEYLDKVIIPTEIWQYLKRGMCFLITAIAVYHLSVKQQIIAIKVFLFVSFLFLFIGILQLFQMEQLISLYGRTDGQISSALHKNANQRVYSITGHSISWGGMTLFIFYASIALILLMSNLKEHTNKLKKSYVLFITLFFILCLINIIASGSRGTIIAFVISFLLFLILLSLKIGLKSVFILPFIFIALLSIGYIALTLFYEKLSFILFRFEALGETAGGGRDEQILNGLALLDDWYEWIMGVSNSVQRIYGQSWGIESEPFNILVSYGVLGAVLIYSSLFIILLKIRQLYLKRNLFNGDVIYTSMFCGVLGYMLFSFGYFYFAELIVGIYSWLVFGMLIGIGLSLQEKSIPSNSLANKRFN